MTYQVVGNCKTCQRVLWRNGDNSNLEDWNLCMDCNEDELDALDTKPTQPIIIKDIEYIKSSCYFSLLKKYDDIEMKGERDDEQEYDKMKQQRDILLSAICELDNIVNDASEFAELQSIVNKALQEVSK